MNVVEKYFEIPSSYIMTGRATQEEIFEIWRRYPTAVKFAGLNIGHTLEEIDEILTDSEKADMEEILAIIEGNFGEFWDSHRVLEELMSSDKE